MNEDEEFEMISLCCHGKSRKESIRVERAYNQIVPISKEKKQDLFGLLLLIPPFYHSFYKQLKIDIELKDNIPDLEEVVIDSD